MEQRTWCRLWNRKVSRVVGWRVGLLCAGHSFMRRRQSLVRDFSSEGLDRMQSAELFWLVNTGGQLEEEGNTSQTSHMKPLLRTSHSWQESPLLCVSESAVD